MPFPFFPSLFFSFGCFYTSFIYLWMYLFIYLFYYVVNVLYSTRLTDFKTLIYFRCLSVFTFGCINFLNYLHWLPTSSMDRMNFYWVSVGAKSEKRNSWYYKIIFFIDLLHYPKLRKKKLPQLYFRSFWKIEEGILLHP